MSFFSKILPKLGRAPLAPRVFPKTAPRIAADQKVDEENYTDYLAARYYPVRIGDVFAKRYQVVGKLGFGVSSTVWLARDLSQHNHVVLKVFICMQDLGRGADWELDTYEQIESVARISSNPGQHAIRKLLDNFQLKSPLGGTKHHCLVHQPLWENVAGVLQMNPEEGRLPSPVFGKVLQRLFLALDFLHRECHLIHTDIKADNIAFSLSENDPVLGKFEQDEIENPTPRKEVEDGRMIYQSRQMALPDDIGDPVLFDFGTAMSGEQMNPIDAQPDLYRAPEMIMAIPWRYEIDIWNAACLIWDIFEGRHLFVGQDPVENRYRGRAHLGSVIALLGPVPVELASRIPEMYRNILVNEKAEYIAGIPLPPPTSLEQIETTLKGEPDREQFLALMRKMLQWLPENRATAEELLKDEWIQARVEEY